MKRLKTYITLIVIISTFSPQLLAYDLASQVEEFTLKNGMRWLIVRREKAPVVSGVVMVKVGGIDEEGGKTGLAHMFEHMAFKGSTRFGTKDYAKEKPILGEIERTGEEVAVLKKKGAQQDKANLRELEQKLAALTLEARKFADTNAVWEVMERNGGRDLNAFTSKDVTTYYASLPSVRFELWANVIAEMVFDPVFRDFYTERSVVAEERRTSAENDPDGALAEKLLSTAYRDGPHSWSTIGFEKDVQGLTIADAREFHKRYYVPSNMVGVVVGDTSRAKAEKALEKAFGWRGNGDFKEAPPKRSVPAGGIAGSFRFNARPSLVMAYHKPTLPDPVEYTFDVITELLCEGSASRLHKKLVYEKRLAKDIYCSDSYPGSRLPNLFIIWAEPLAGVAPGQLLTEMSQEIERLKTEPLAQQEIKKVRKRVLARFVFSLENNMELALALARFETVFSNWRLLANYAEKIAGVTQDTVLNVANEYLKDSNRVVVERLPK